MNMIGTYTVSLYATPMSFPLNFTIHSWVKISHNEHTERYDLWAYPGLKTASAHKGYIYKDIFPDHLGTTFWPLARMNTLHNRQTGQVLESISGSEGSLPHQLYTAITEKAFEYPAYNKYNMILGPSCNTYTQWLLSLVPEAGLSLPWYAWGKGNTV